MPITSALATSIRSRISSALLFAVANDSDRSIEARPSLYVTTKVFGFSLMPALLEAVVDEGVATLIVAQGRAGTPSLVI